MDRKEGTGKTEMRPKRAWIFLLVTMLGLLAGIALGLYMGWWVAPVEYVDTSLVYLHPIYKSDFILMVSEAYALDGDLDIVKARLALLTVSDPADAVADAAESAVNQGQPVAQIRVLARLAAALGAQRDSLLPYLSTDEQALATKNELVRGQVP